VDVTMPKWGMTMQAATLAEWYVSVGDRVVEGQPLARVESDKVDVDVEAPGAGVVAELLVFPGVDAKVGDVIARITVGAE
jgi:pyruvate/2-oxoglutarate dehydrogenase complex dihydrolipoamide acyltransferase (E2) component